MTSTDRITRDEAHDLYMRIFNEFAVDRRDVEDVQRTKAVVEAINVRLADHGSDQTIVDDTVNDQARIWQCFQTYDHCTEEQAEEAFNAAWPAELEMDAIAPKSTRSSTTVESGVCRCGCGDHTAPGKGYLPGHDARHAGQVARAILNLNSRKATPEQYRLLETLPTEALRRKAMGQVTRGNAKQQSVPSGGARRVMARLAPDGVVHGYVMVPRPTFRIGQRVPAQTFLVSGEQRMNINDAKDGSGDWLDAEGYNGQTQKYWLKRFRPTTTV